jgi:hypothetical protein
MAKDPVKDFILKLKDKYQAGKSTDSCCDNPYDGILCLTIRKVSSIISHLSGRMNKVANPKPGSLLKTTKLKSPSSVKKPVPTGGSGIIAPLSRVPRDGLELHQKPAKRPGIRALKSLSGMNVQEMVKVLNQVELRTSSMGAMVRPLVRSIEPGKVPYRKVPPGAVEQNKPQPSVPMGRYGIAKSKPIIPPPPLPKPQPKPGKTINESLRPNGNSGGPG